MEANDGADVRATVKKAFLRSTAALCILSLVSLAAAGFFLKRGIHLEQLTVGPAVVSDCDLVWNKKLELQIGSISVTRKERASASKTDLKVIRKSLYTSHKFARLFSFVNIENFSVGGQRVEVKLSQNDTRNYLLSLATDQVDFQARLVFAADRLIADIVKFNSQRFNSSATGQVILEKDKDQLTGVLSALINGSFPVTVEFTGDGDMLSFSGTEEGPIYEIAPLVDLFGLSHNIQRWITEYLSGSQYHLRYFKGQFPWNKPGVLLDTLEAEVRVDDTEYTFAQGFEPIKAEYTDVFFSKGVLEIKPKGGTFYRQSGGDSWLDINFNDPANITLTAYIITSAVANDDILTLLGHYGIALPFKQVGGTTDTDLTLTINLNKLEIGAQAQFVIDQGEVSYDGVIFDVSNAHISLENADVVVDQLTFGYLDIFSARVAGVIGAKNGTADLQITLEQVGLDINEILLKLDDTATKPNIRYRLQGGEQNIEVSPTFWQLGANKIGLDAFHAPIDLKEFSMELPPVIVGVNSTIQAEVSGLVALKEDKTDLRCDLLQFNLNDMELVGEPVSIHIEHDQGWRFITEDPANLRLSGIPVTLYPSEYVLDDKSFRVLESRISYGSFFDSRVVGHFQRDISEGVFYLKKIDVTNEKLEKNLEIGDEVLVLVSTAGGHFIIYCPEFDLRIRADENKNWSAYFGDFSKLYSHSPLLRDYGLKQGSMTISSVNGSTPYAFSADFNSPYHLLIDSDGAVDELSIQGNITDQGVSATVNDELHLEIVDNKVSITSTNLGFNIPAIKKLFDDRSQLQVDSEISGKDVLLSFEAKNSHLYFSPKSKILADLIELEYFRDAVGMRLTHGPGVILLKMEGDHFLANGEYLNDAFMGALIQSSRFREGEMSITAAGSLTDFSALFVIKNTVLEDLKTLNNVMALLNTVPALITFSLPEYSLTGLPLESAIVGIQFKNRYATVESLEFISPSLRGAGLGWIDFAQKQMDLDVNLTSQRKVNIRKIPLAGYILEGEKGEASMTIDITGDLENPYVTHSLFREIAAKPFKVLWRILKLPVDIVRELGEGDLSGEQSSGAMN